MGVPGNANALLLASAAVSGAYQISRSLRFNSADSAYLNRTPASAGNRKTFTFSCWVKKCKNASADELTLLGGLSTASNNPRTTFYYDVSSDVLVFDSYSTAFDIQLKTSAVFRDNSAWAHVLLVVDTTQSTSTNRVKIYINNVQLTAFGTSTYPSQNFDTHINAAAGQFIGSFRSNAGYFNGYLADVHFIDGQALDPSSFTTTDLTTGQLVPKAYTGGSYGTNGFHLDFADNSSNTATTLGKDTSGNGNNWTPNNLSVTAGAGNDSLTDTPTSYGTDTGVGGEVRGNYATFNPIANPGGSTLTNGNLDLSGTASGSWRSQPCTIAFDSGKYYWEVTVTSSPSGALAIGVASTITNVSGFFFPGYVGTATYGYMDTGTKWTNGSETSYGASYTLNDVIGVSLDMSTGALVFYKNGTSQGTAFTVDATKIYIPHVGYSNTQSCVINFGQRPFAYTAPSGFKALNTANLPTPVVAKPSDVMDVVTYTGTGSNPRTLSGLAFSPDFVWIKDRSESNWHRLNDTVRGSNKTLFSNDTAAELANDTNGYLSAFTSDGFTVTNGSISANGVNKLNNAYVAWTWDAGSSTVTNTAGSITTSCRTNTSAGFSVATWTGSGSGSATVGHGLGVAPRFMIIKDRSLARNWLVYHTSLGATSGVGLNSTNAASGADAGWWNNTAPTSTVATIGTYGNEASNYVGYFWTPVVGYSSFGSYTGNGSATDNTFVYTGMRPRFVMLKRSDSTGNWVIWDAVRNSYNVANSIFLPNSSAAEYSPDAKIDILSNGFKVRDNSSDSGTNGATYIYAAFAESPFQFARAR